MRYCSDSGWPVGGLPKNARKLEPQVQEVGSAWLQDGRLEAVGEGIFRRDLCLLCGMLPGRRITPRFERVFTMVVLFS